jgi:hypothetical protein
VSKHQHTLTITSHDAIPPDVLVEHIAYALRTGLQLSGPFNVAVNNRDGYSQRYVTYEGEVR